MGFYFLCPRTPATKSHVRNFRLMAVALWLCVWFGTSGRATTFEYADGTKIEGEIVQGKPEFLQLRLEGNRYEKLAWDKLSQTTLKELAADPKLKLEAFIQPYLEGRDDSAIKKTEVVIKPVPRLERPAKGSLPGALLGSSVGLLALLLVYAANIYAGYEISVIRAYPAGMVCGIAAVAPIIGPVVFLCLPTKMNAAAEEEIPETTAPVVSAEADPETAAKVGAGGLTLAHTEAAPRRRSRRDSDLQTWPVHLQSPVHRNQILRLLRYGSPGRGEESGAGDQVRAWRIHCHPDLPDRHQRPARGRSSGRRRAGSANSIQRNSGNPNQTPRRIISSSTRRPPRIAP